MKKVINFIKDQFILHNELKKLRYLLKSIAENTRCIGVTLCHVDGNCIHCTAKWALKD